MTQKAKHNRRFIVPEVVQTSAMDCGPASLKCLLEGYGIPVSYGRLREACQTDVDGTSIDTLEEIAQQLGLEAEQTMIPVDHLLLKEAEALPALLVVWLANRFTHFVVVWRRHGPFVQVMDPGAGRKWMTCEQLLRDVYVHEFNIAADAWHSWAKTDGFLRPLGRRLKNLGIGRAARSLIQDTLPHESWEPLAKLDAATRLITSLVGSGGVRRGREARDVLTSLLKEDDTKNTIPEIYWSARAAPTQGEVILRGAVLVRVQGPSKKGKEAQVEEKKSELSPELKAALTEKPTRPALELLKLLRGDGWLSFSVLFFALAFAAGSVILESLLLRGIIDLGHDLGLVTQRLQAVGVFLIFALALLFLELKIFGGLTRLGRRLETKLRLAFLQKLPRLIDRYFQSRPISDMTERSHSLQQLRTFPRLGGQFIRSVMSLVAVSAAIAWIYPGGALIGFLSAGLSVALPLVFKPVLEEVDLRIRTHTGALSRFYLDALLGIGAIRAHGATRAVRTEQENLLIEWVKTSLRLIRAAVTLEALQALVGYGCAAWLLLSYASHVGDPSKTLLLAYWALYLPVLGEEIGRLVRQYPIHRNLTLRLLEPLGAREEKSAEAQEKVTKTSKAARLSFESITVLAAGHTILEELNLTIDAGSHVAIVGPSGAGKSSFVGLLLGWHRAASGAVLIDGEALDPARLDQLRRETVWVDPAVQIWNRTLLNNLRYGNQNGSVVPVGQALERADLFGVIKRLPEGLQTYLGEGGGLLSGGEGQRVRFGRGVFRPNPRLVILDEPFRGLDRRKRHTLLEGARELWRDSTVLCITHDVSETLDFERVLVIDNGHVVEDDRPSKLADNPASRYRALLDDEERVLKGIWSDPAWRRLRLEDGRLQETHRGGQNGE